MKFVKDTGVTLATNFVTMAMGFITNIIIARYLGPKGKGIIAICFLFSFISALIIGLGIDEANAYMIAKNKNNHSHIFSNFLIFSIIISFIYLVIIYLFRKPITTHIIKNLQIDYFNIAIITVPLFVLFNNALGILRGYREFYKFNILSIIHRGGELIFTFILSIAFGILGAVIAIPLALIIPTISVLFFLSRYGKIEMPNLKLFKNSLFFGIRANPRTICDILNKRLNMFIINFFVDITKVGYYSVAVVFAELLSRIPNAFGLTLFPKIAQLPKDEGDKFTSLVLRNVIFIIIGGSILLALIIRPLIFLTVGERFYPSIYPFLILLPGTLFMGITKILTSNFQGQGKPEYGTYIIIVGVISMVFLNILLIPKYEIIGAAVASTISYSIPAILSIIIFKNRSNIKVKEFLLLNKNPVQEIKTLIREEIK